MSRTRRKPPHVVLAVVCHVHPLASHPMLEAILRGSETVFRHAETPKRTVTLALALPGRDPSATLRCHADPKCRTEVRAQLAVVHSMLITLDRAHPQESYRRWQVTDQEFTVMLRAPARVPEYLAQRGYSG